MRYIFAFVSSINTAKIRKYVGTYVEGLKVCMLVYKNTADDSVKIG